MNVVWIESNIRGGCYDARTFDEIVAYQETLEAKRQQFKDALRKVSGELITDAQFEKAFAFAWDQEHSYGYQEVLSCFVDIVDIITAKDAG